jgi:hypothetical protein
LPLSSLGLFSGSLFSGSFAGSRLVASPEGLLAATELVFLGDGHRAKVKIIATTSTPPIEKPIISGVELELELRFLLRNFFRLGRGRSSKSSGSPGTRNADSHFGHRMVLPGAIESATFSVTWHLGQASFLVSMISLTVCVDGRGRTLMKVAIIP